VAQLGVRYQGSTDISLVHMTHSTYNGFEMQLPFTPPDLIAWQQAGYTEDLEIGSWRSVLDAFRASFPGHSLDVDVHPVLGSDRVAQDVVAHGNATIGGRFGVFAAWWSQNNTGVYPGMFALLRQAAGASFAAVQMVASYTLTPDRFGPGGIERAIDLAACTGVRYEEVWNNDILNPALEQLLRDAAARLSCAGSSLCHGVGCAGSGGTVPILSVGGCPTPGGTVTLAVSQGLPGSAALLALGLVRAGEPMGGGCFLLLTPPWFSGIVLPLSGSGSASLPVTLPRAFLGSLTLQAFLLDGGVPQGFSDTNGIEVTIR
jgi:hypothetical protein